MIELVWQDETEEYGYYRASVTVASGDASDYVKTNYNTQPTVAVYPSGRCYVEYTLSTPAVIDAGNAEWIKWPIGNTRRNAADTVVGVVSAVRLVSITGAATMEVLSK